MRICIRLFELSFFARYNHVFLVFYLLLSFRCGIVYEIRESQNIESLKDSNRDTSQAFSMTIIPLTLRPLRGVKIGYSRNSSVCSI
ncbi:hypothetical protein [Helicobacter aurati]|uniref:hypothetical protein n=1 Tax=Helicobacter aurati TaxID=137778 RepID=UPI0011C03FCA|nr:hypothetical protein [Helicobacter aurati]